METAEVDIQCNRGGSIYFEKGEGTATAPSNNPPLRFAIL